MFLRPSPCSIFPDVAVLDVMMPGLSGIAADTKIHESGRLPAARSMSSFFTRRAITAHRWRTHPADQSIGRIDQLRRFAELAGEARAK